MKALSTLIPAAVMLAVWASAAENANDLFQRALQKERGDGNPAEAIRLYQRIVDKYASNRAVAAKALERIGQCHEKLGSVEARKAYERLVREFGDQKDPAATARTRLAALGKPAAPSGISVRRVFEDLPGDPSAVSPDGRYVLHYEDRTLSNYMARDLATGKSRRLTSYEKSAGRLSWDPLFSPDSRRIAYAAWSSEMNELHVVGVDGAGDRVVWRFDEYFELRGWFPDGSRVAVLAWPNGKEGMKLLAVSLADGAVKVLKEADAKTFKGGWLSPDGKYFAFKKETSKDPLQNDIWCLSLESGGETPLVVYPADNGSPRWTPDGKGIFYSSDRRGTLGIWYLPVSAGKPAGQAELIKGGIGESFWPIGLTHDGTVYYVSNVALANSLMAEFDRAASRIVSGPSEVAPKSSGRTQNAAFSADGKQLAYYRKKRFDSGRYTLILRSLATGEEREIATQFDAVHAQQWFPDGRSLLVYGTDRGIVGGRYYRFDIATGKATPLVRSRTTFHALSPDGKTLYFVRGEPSDLYTAEIDFATGKVLAQPAPVTNRFWGTNMGPTWSPDGQYLAYHSWRSWRYSVLGNLTIVIKSAKTGEERDLSVKLAQDAPVRWFPDGKSFLVYGSAEEDFSRPQIYRVNAETGEVSLIKTVTAAGQIGGELSPDGKAIFYVLRETGKVDRIMVYQIDTKEERELFRSVPPQSMVRFWPLPSPDGRQLAFVLHDAVAKTAAIKVIPARGGEPRELAGGLRSQDAGEGAIAGWSPDGRYLYFATAGQSAGLWRVATDGGAPKRLEVNIKGLSYPSLHPDGRHITFSADLDPAYALSARNLETGEERVLLQGDNVSMYPAVSPDGRQLAVARIQGSDSLIEILPLGGGKQSEILRLPAAEALLGHPAFSPDGREIFFSRRAPKGERIELWRVSAQGGTPFKTDVWVLQPREQAQDWDKGRIVPPPSDYSAQQFRGLAFHPDGRRFVFDTGLQRVEFWAMENFLPKAAK